MNSALFGSSTFSNSSEALQAKPIQSALFAISPGKVSPFVEGKQDADKPLNHMAHPFTPQSNPPSSSVIQSGFPQASNSKLPTFGAPLSSSALFGIPANSNSSGSFYSNPSLNKPKPNKTSQNPFPLPSASTLNSQSNPPSSSLFALQTPPQPNMSLFGSFQPQAKANTGFSLSQSSTSSSFGLSANPFEGVGREPQSKVKESSIFSQTDPFKASEEENKISIDKDKAPPKSKLSCIICYEKYNTSKIIPKVMFCGHSICSLCLEKMSLSKNSIICPLCSSRDPRKASQIPINFAVYETCEENKIADFCKEHNKEIGLFCKEDHHLLCFNCVIQHKAHEILMLNDEYVGEVVNNKKRDIIKAEEKFKEKIGFCEENLKILKADRSKIQELIDNHIREYDKTQKQLIEILERSSETLRQNLNNKYKSIFETNQTSIENYNSITADFKKKKEELEKLGKDFNAMTITDKINCQIVQLDEEMAYPEMQNVENIMKSLEELIDYKGEMLEKFNENFK